MTLVAEAMVNHDRFTIAAALTHEDDFSITRGYHVITELTGEVDTFVHDFFFGERIHANTEAGSVQARARVGAIDGVADKRSVSRVKKLRKVAAVFIAS